MSRVIVVLSFCFTLLFATLSDDNFKLDDSVEFHKLDGVSDDFQSVTFLNSYASKPIVVCIQNLPSYREADAAIRIRNRTTSGFDIRVQRPVDADHVDTKVQCIVAKEGKNTLPDGYLFEAHEVESQDTSGNYADGWAGTGEDVSGDTGNYGTRPVVLGQVMSYNDERFSLFWTYDCSNAGYPPTSDSICVGKHIGRTSDRLPEREYSETLGYIVIESDKDGDGNADGDDTISSSIFPFAVTHYRVELGGNAISGTADGGGSYSVGYDYKLGAATQSAMDGIDGGWTVFLGSDPFEGNNIDLGTEEDTLDGTDRNHTREQVSYWLFDQDPGLDWMEVQKFENVKGTFETFTFKNSYTKAVPVCTYHLKDRTDNEAVVRIRDIGQNSMQMKIQRPKNSTDVTAGDVYCIIVEEGNHTIGGTFLGGGRKLEAYRIDSDDTNSKALGWDASYMEQVTYQQSYNKPVVLGQVISYNNEAWTTFWSCNIDGDRLNPPDENGGFYAGKHIGKESLPPFRKNETIGYIIGRSNEGEVNHIHYALKRGKRTIDGTRNKGDSYDFSEYVQSHYSYGVASQNGMVGGDGGWAVLYGNDPINEKIYLAIDEESVESDRWHVKERVSYWVFEKMPVMAVAKASCIVKDPVNDRDNPKRIPGATIRYIIDVNNTGPGDAGDVVVDDNLSVYYDAATATTPKVLTGKCGECTTLSGGSESGDINGSKVLVDFGTVAAGSETAPTQKCGYFEVEIK